MLDPWPGAGPLLFPFPLGFPGPQLLVTMNHYEEFVYAGVVHQRRLTYSSSVRKTTSSESVVVSALKHVHVMSKPGIAGLVASFRSPGSLRLGSVVGLR